MASIGLTYLVLMPVQGFTQDDRPPSEKHAKSRLTIDRIYEGDEFVDEEFSAKWLTHVRDEANAKQPHIESPSYTALEPAETNGQGKDIVRFDAATGKARVMVSSADLIPPGEKKPLEISDYAWSEDHNLLLIFTNTKRVWRKNTRGDYWILDRSSRQLTKLGGDAPASTLMFAKLSPTGKHVAYVRDGNIYVENLFDQTITSLTKTETDDVINGTTDWVYEEEFGVRDGFRWSPDGSLIAFWQIDTSNVQRFPLVNNTDSLYPRVHWFPYPKVGQRNPKVRIGIASIESRVTRWIDLPPGVGPPGEPAEFYIPRMQWMSTGTTTSSPNQLLVQQMNRLQNRNRLIAADANATVASTILIEKDDAWVDIHDEVIWLKDGKTFTWISERDGWRHVYLGSRDGKSDLRQVTKGPFDVIELLAVDEDDGMLYFIASPEAPSERYLYSVNLDGTDLQRLTPNTFVGHHSYQISPDAGFAIHKKSSMDVPTVTELVSLPDHKLIRVLESNETLRENIEKLDRSPSEFFRVDIGDRVELEAWCIKPPNMDPSRKHPLLIYVYGEPAGTTVVNRWGGKSYLWHLMLAQRGYVVMSFDNRGTKSPRGRAWRKSIYGKIGILPPKDQAAAAKSVLADRQYLDPGRVGIWGWSGGGSSSLHAIFKYPDLYRTAIAIAPVPNQRYYDTIYQERYMGLPRQNVEGFREGSAINFAKQLEGQLLLIHGTGDDNCHYQTTEMLIDELIAHNKPFEMMAYPNRTHAIRERKNTTRHMRSLMTEFLFRHLPVEDSQ